MLALIIWSSCPPFWSLRSPVLVMTSPFFDQRICGGGIPIAGQCKKTDLLTIDLGLMSTPSFSIFAGTTEGTIWMIRSIEVF
jgi:hypothetical protein